MIKNYSVSLGSDLKWHYRITKDAYDNLYNNYKTGYLISKLKKTIGKNPLFIVSDLEDIIGLEVKLYPTIRESLKHLHIVGNGKPVRLHYVYQLDGITRFGRVSRAFLPTSMSEESRKLIGESYDDLYETVLNNDNKGSTPTLTQENQTSQEISKEDTVETAEAGYLKELISDKNPDDTEQVSMESPVDEIKLETQQIQPMSFNTPEKELNYNPELNLNRPKILELTGEVAEVANGFENERRSRHVEELIANNERSKLVYANSTLEVYADYDEVENEEVKQALDYLMYIGNLPRQYDQTGEQYLNPKGAVGVSPNGQYYRLNIYQGILKNLSELADTININYTPAVLSCLATAVHGKFGEIDPEAFNTNPKKEVTRAELLSEVGKSKIGNLTTLALVIQTILDRGNQLGISLKEGEFPTLGSTMSRELYAKVFLSFGG